MGRSKKDLMKKGKKGGKKNKKGKK